MNKSILLRNKYKLDYRGSEMFVYGEPMVVWLIDKVDGVNAGNGFGVAVGVNDNYILFRQEANRKYDKDVWYITMDKATSKEVKHLDGKPNPKVYGRFSKIKEDFTDGTIWVREGK